MESESGGASLPSIGADATKRRVSYFYEPGLANYNYGKKHDMKPQRISMAHSLITGYQIDHNMTVYRPFPATSEDIGVFHTKEYVDFLSTVTRSTRKPLKEKFNIGPDCPAFKGVFPFSQASAGGSIGAAVLINRGDADIAINWAGGLHHAKKNMASGFCYVNDIVLGILELLKVYTVSFSY
jgi:histone deacetylase 1/2